MSTVSTIDELRGIDLFADLPEEQFVWLAEQATLRDLEAGEVLMLEGESADHMFALVRGQLLGRREQRQQGAADTWLYVWKAGEVSGMLPFSRMTHYPITARAVVPTRVAAFRTGIFPEMQVRIPTLVERLVHITLDRARMAVRDEEQSQSQTALHRITAGMAHELYNPTAAALRAAKELRQRFSDFRRSSINLAQHDVHDDALRTLAALDQREPPDLAGTLDPIARSERIEQLGEWLDDRSVPRAWSLADGFLDAGVDVADLNRLAAVFPDEALGDALIWLDALLSADYLLQDVENSATRVAGLVDTLKSYSLLDRPTDMVDTDIHAAIDSTVRMLDYKLRAKRITVTREYDPELPHVNVNAGEMNQVWTNLLDNAIDAVADRGRITVRTAREPLHILVEIADNGSGIPIEIQSRIWDPFFTTKDVGKGTGLGLDIVRRIVERRHQGEVRVESVPGETRFQMRLPRTNRA